MSEMGLGCEKSTKEFPMRLIYLSTIVVFAAAVIIFAFQNLAIVTVSFLGVSISVRIAILVFVVYILGAATGGSLFALLRGSYRGSRMR
jgi:putative membrane protein